MASYSVETGSLDLNGAQMRALRAIASQCQPDAAPMATLRAARIVDENDRIHKGLRTFAEQLGAATTEWSFVCVEPGASYRYRILATEHSIIGHCEPISETELGAATANPVLFTHRGRLGVVILQLLALPPRAKGLPTGGRGRTLSWERLVRAVSGGPDQSPWKDEPVRRLWSIAATVPGMEQPLFGVETTRERLAIGHPIGLDEILLVGSGPEAAFRYLSSHF